MKEIPSFNELIEKSILSNWNLDALTDFKGQTLQYHDVARKIEKLHIIGGGSANELLNQWTANAIGLPVVAGPTEATAIGNVMMQAKAAGLVKDRWEMRRMIANTFNVKTYNPS